MKAYRAAILLFVAGLVILSLACVRSIPGSTVNPTPTRGKTTAPATTATDVMNQIYLFATQTAIASQGGAPAAPAPTIAAPVAPGQVQPTRPVVVQPPAPTPVPPTIAPPPPAAVPASYVLQKGEFPYCIARRFNVDPGELLRVNGLSNYSVFSAGMNLRVPQSGRPFPGSRALLRHPTSYTVRGGDTIYSIACAFGDVDPNAILVVNPGSSQRPNPGTVLQIP